MHTLITLFCNWSTTVANTILVLIPCVMAWRIKSTNFHKIFMCIILAIVGVLWVMMQICLFYVMWVTGQIPPAIIVIEIITLIVSTYALSMLCELLGIE